MTIRKVVPSHVNAVGETFKMGRNLPTAKGPRLSLKNYLLRGLPTPPPSVDYTQNAGQVLSQMYLNDKYGICVIAAIAHIEGVLVAAAGGTPKIYTDAELITLYSAIGGFVPGQPNTDQGASEQTGLNYWQTVGAPAGSNKISGWMDVNPADPVEYKTALWLFENLFLGICVPNAYVNISSNGFVWDVGQPNPNNGHAVPSFSYDASSIGISTWGLYGKMTDRAIKSIITPRYNGEMHVVITPDAINKATAKAPNGFDWMQLQKDFQNLGGNIVPTPSPNPWPPVPQPPAPSPTPVPGPIVLPPFIGQIIDQIFVTIEAQFAGRPLLLWAVKIIHTFVTSWLAANLQDVHSRLALAAPNQNAAIPAILTDAVDAAFDYAIKEFPAYADLLTVLKALFDKHIATL